LKKSPKEKTFRPSALRHSVTGPFFFRIFFSCFFATFLYAAPEPFSTCDSECIAPVSPKDSSTTPDTRPTPDPFMTHGEDSSIPFPTRFSWCNRLCAEPRLVALFLSEDTIFTNADLFLDNFRDTMAAIWNLKINTPYFWKVCIADSQASALCSPVFSFKTPDAWPRMIYLEGTTNVRDIGGRTTMDGVMIKQGLFFRSAELNQNYTITANGLAQLMRLGIVTDIDLRNKSENARPALPAPIRYFHPITDSGMEILSYLNGLVNTPALYRDVFRVLADSGNYPLICHCLAGADRTGTVSALLEALLGNSQQQIGDDYQWTSLSVNGSRDTNSLEWRNTVTYIRSFDKLTSSIQAGAWYYLQSIGVKAQELVKIRKIFLGDGRQPFPELSVHPRGPCSPKPKAARTTRKQFVNRSKDAIIYGSGAKHAALFNLSGQKVHGMIDDDAAGERRTRVPGIGRGVYVLHEEIK
jgi:protein-tyrosine phosphatase